jgi:hypothetical protein
VPSLGYIWMMDYLSYSFFSFWFFPLLLSSFL